MIKEGNGKRPEYVVFGAKESFVQFQKERMDRFESLGSKTRPGKVDYKMFCNIIRKYLTIYVYELLFINDIIYFPLGGKARINRCAGWIRKDQSSMKAAATGKLKKTNLSVGVFWFDRPFFMMNFMALKKRTGSTNIFPVIEKQWKRVNEIDLLPTVNDLLKRYKISRFKVEKYKI